MASSAGPPPGLSPFRRANIPGIPSFDTELARKRASSHNPTAILRLTELEPLLPHRPRAWSALPTFETDNWSLSRVPPMEPGQHIGVFRGTCMLMSMMLGAGLFISPGVVLQYVGSVPLALGAYVFGGALCMVGALCYAELGTTLPVSGGEYTYFNAVLGRPIAFSFVWTTFWMLKAASQSIFALTISQTLGSIIFGLPLHSADDTLLWPVKLGAMVVLVVLCGVNCCGVHWGAYVGVLVTVLNMGTVSLLLGMGTMAIFRADHLPPPPPQKLEPLTPITHLGLGPAVNNFGLAVLVCLWAYDGWNGLNYATGLLEKPQRTLPRCIAYGVGAIVAIYLTVTLIYLGSLDPAVVAHSPVVAVALGQRVLGKLGQVLVGVAISISCTGALNGSILTGSQIYYRAAADGIWPSWFHHLHPRSKAPTRALVVQCGWVCIATCAGALKVLISYFSFCVFLFYGLAVLCLLVLRQTRDPTPGAYHTPLYPFFPVLFLCLTAGIIVNAVTAAPLGSALTLAFITVSLPLSYLCGCGPEEAEISAGLQYEAEEGQGVGVKDWRAKVENFAEGGGI